VNTKLVSRQEAQKRIEAWRSAEKKIGFTSGTFDLLHAGHVEYLCEARAHCDFLVVGLNSDISVKRYKDPLRPICEQQDRAAVLAGLSVVDLIFIFDETNNNENIRLLHPDYYIKAGDYDRSKLSSAALVEAYGGKVILASFKKGFSTTALIERICALSADAKTVAGTERVPESRPAVFLDRDGTIIEHVEYLHEPSKVKLIAGATTALKQLQDNGYRLVVITNQPGMGLGYFTKEDFFAVNREFFKQVSRAGVLIDRVYFCPHSQADKCSCRKPGTELIERAAKDLNIDLAKSFMVGDMSGDIQLGVNVGCRTVLVRTGQGGKDKIFAVTPDAICDSLLEGAEFIVGTGAG